jgi:GDP-4-dehydro-6-deoxy-D-mannose reductase
MTDGRSINKERSAINSPKTLVTGCKGFVGQHYCSRYGGHPLADDRGDVDLCDAARVLASIDSLRPDAVLHLAAQSSVASSFKDPAATLAVNFLGTLNLLQALTAVGFHGAFLYVGSADVYGHVPDSELPVREARPLYPRSPFAVSKVAAEALCFQWSQTEGFRIVLSRPFNQIGPGQDTRFAIADFARQIAEVRLRKRSPILTTGDIDVTRDFTDVRDAVRAYHLLLETGKNGEAYNICTGQDRSIRALIEEMFLIAGIDAELRADPARLRPVEQRRMAGDPNKIREQSGWVAEIPLHQTLSDILQEAEIGI